ncbi:uncharacterized protein LOC120633471 [Pararge aegeria]|uniref:uncharacterized protein LOC120633471 n=1 Tax=Pararge aegeria TaxID=116150 RepID=UPI0019D1CB68|nr:uncharacterized protein LOC120633471 [Pararge aegeria]
MNEQITTQINHLMYMDDIKLYATTQKDLYQLANLTEQYSQDICMEFGIDKCKINAIKDGQSLQHTYHMEAGQQINSLEETEVYKYLGYNQGKLIEYKNTKTKLIQQFKHRLNSLATVQSDAKLTPLNLKDKTFQKNETQTTEQTKINEWARKSLHGRHRHDLCQPNVDKAASNAWLSRGELFPETEGFMIAIQDQIIETRNYQRHIMRILNLPTDLCRKCNSNSETIQHITGACKLIAQTEYKHRHDQAANIIHQKLAYKYNLISNLKPIPYYKYVPESVLENNEYRLYFDRAILTDRTIHYNRPDITLQDKKNRTAIIIDIAIPNTHNLQNTISEKLSKYTDLKDEIKRMWRLNEVSIVPIVLSTTGVIPKQLHQSLSLLNLPEFTYISLQKAVILNTCRIVRKFLQGSEEPTHRTGEPTHNHNNAQPQPST